MSSKSIFITDPEERFGAQVDQIKRALKVTGDMDANLQVGDADVSDANPVPISDAGGSLTVDQLSEYNADDPHGPTDKGLFALAVRNDNAATSFTGATGDYSAIAVDEQGRLFVRQMDRKIKLTGSTDGKPIAITNFATPGNVIDLTADLGAGQGYAYFLKASFVTQAASEKDATLTIEFGGVAVSELLTFTVPIEDTIIIACGEPLYANALTIAAFVGTDVQQVNITGWKELIIA